MKNIFIESLTESMEITDFFMLKNIDIKVGSNKKEYLDMVVVDRTGEVSAKKWDIPDSERTMIEELKTGDLIKVKATIITWQGNVQMKVMRMRKATEEDALILSDYIRTAPEDSSTMYEYIYECAASMVDEEFSNVAKTILEDNKDKLLYYPAASKNHHALYGGLLYHMKRMIMSGKALSQVYPILNQDLLICGIILHDMEKIREIDADEQGISSGYSMEGQLLGHISQGVREFGKRAESMNLSEEKAIMLEHMILSHHYEPEFGSPVKPMFPEAEMLHYLDVVDARMYDMEEALRGVPNGGFSNRVWILDNRRLYKPTF